MTMAEIFGLLNYWVVVLLMMIGFYMVIARQNFIKKIIGLNIFQISVILMYITMGKVAGGTAPIVSAEIANRFAHHEHHGGTGHSHADKKANLSLRDDGKDHQFSEGESLSDANHHDHDHDPSVSDEFHPADHDSHDGEDGHHRPEMDATIYSNPLPSVLMLTAIVVGVGTTAVALALVVRIREDYGTIEEDDVLERDQVSP